MTITPGVTNGVVDSVKIEGAGNAAVNIEEEAANGEDMPPGKVIVFRLSGNTLEKVAEFDANADLSEINVKIKANN